MFSKTTDDIRAWIFEAALPFWSLRGIEAETGRYVEHFTLSGSAFSNYRRVFVICRQIYVFSHASLLGWPDGARHAQRGYDFLVSKAWLGSEGGWARRLDRDGAVIDATPDLYTLGFVLFALAWHYRVSGDPAVLGHAERTLDYLNTEMRHPSGVGFWHEKPGPGARLQNPHMHLLEAALALLEFTGHSRARALADDVVALFAARLFDRTSGTLAEYFDDAFNRTADAQGRLTEPGHQFEWSWILANYQRLTGDDIRDIAHALYNSAETRGVDPTDRRTYNAVRDDGMILDGGSRAWPNTERIKAAVAMFELFGHDPRPAIVESTRLLFERYLAHEPAGTWIDTFDAAGRPAAEKIPTSTLYHVFLAFAEVLRVAPRIDARWPE